MKQKSLFLIETLESRDVYPLIAAINSVGGWPILESLSNYDILTYDWKDSLAKIYGYSGQSIIYSISVKPDANDTLVNRFYVRIHSIYKEFMLYLNDW
jgi:uncharacterized lipoprotein